MTLLPFPANTFAIWPLNMGKSTLEHIAKAKVHKHIGLSFGNTLALKSFGGFNRLADLTLIFLYWVSKICLMQIDSSKSLYK